jgi:hypothetical protein
MRKELDEELCRKYPKIFANRYKDMKETAMCWGFDCGDGWYNILDILCANIQDHIDWSVKNHKADCDYNDMITAALAGDLTLLDKYCEGWLNGEDRIKEMLERGLRTVREPVPQVVADQVKEKFGGLRFYFTGGDDKIYGMARMAESMSYRTCEECGNPGKSNSDGWISTLCDVHRKEREHG